MTTKRILVLEQAINVLNCFTGHQSSLSLAELDSILEIPKSTIHRILISLADKDVLAYDKETHQYTFGRTIMSWGGTVFHRLRILEVARPYLTSFRDMSSETATLTLRIGLRRMYIDQVGSRNEVRMAVELGKWLPLYAGANGKAILAYMKSDEVEQVISEYGLQRFTPTTITSRQELLEDLQKIREDGFAVSAGERVAESVSVAAPFILYPEGQIGSIGLSGPSVRFTIEKARDWGPDLRGAAREISNNTVWYES